MRCKGAERRDRSGRGKWADWAALERDVAVEGVAVGAVDGGVARDKKGESGIVATLSRCMNE